MPVEEKKAKGKKGEDNLTQLVQWFEDSEEATNDARAQSECDRDYYDGKQWTETEKAKLKKRNQPALVFNKVKRKINFLTGHEAQTKADPKAYPRNYPHDEEGAEAATDALRYVQQSQLLEDKFSSVFENLAVEGYGGVEVLYDARKQEVQPKVWAWDRLFYDPYSSKADFSDAKYKGGVVWMDEDDAKERYPNNHEAIDATLNDGRRDKSETYDDKPKTQWVSSGTRKRVRVVQIYWEKGRTWWWAHFTKGGMLDGNMEVAFLNEDGESECPLILQSAYVDRDNNRYGEVRELRDIQDEVNKRRSKLLYQLSVRGVVADKGAVDNREKARQELARPDFYIEKNPNREFNVDWGQQMAAGQAQLLQEAKQEMEFAGPNASLMGDTKSGASGRAIIASQQGGLTELGRFLARYRHFRLAVYRQIWNRIRQFWKEEKWVRVTDNEQNVKFVGLNIPETLEDVFIAKVRQETDDPDEIQQAIETIKAQPDAKLETGGLKNNVAEMDMDIIIDEAPDTVTIQQEQFEQVVQLAQAGVPFSPEDIVELSNLRNKDKVLERMREHTSPQVPPEIQQIQMRDAAAKVAEQEGKAAKVQAEAEQTQVETAQTAFELGVSATGAVQ